MRFSLDVIRARKGDCLMLHFGTADKPRLILIDGGPKSVYTPFLKPRIKAIRDRLGLEPDQPLPVDRLMVSHVDDDHIQGILDLTRDLLAQTNPKHRLVKFTGLWHNSFEHVIGHQPDELTAAFKSQFGAASTGGELPDDATLDDIPDDVDEETVVSSLKVLSSIEQGAQLRADAERLRIALNPEFDGGLILAGHDVTSVDMGAGLNFTVVGPAKPELEALFKKHEAWLKELEKEGKTPEEVLAAYVDKSVTNLSSIVVLAEAGGKRILLTGDARGDKILEGLERAHLLKAGDTTHVDVLKVPHHGSANNLDDDFFQRITADHYVLSGDGEHGNPERETLQMLLDARGRAKYTVHLTYPVAEIDVEREKEWNKERGKEQKKRLKNPKQKVRPEWSPKEHGLVAFLAAHKDFAKKVRVVDPGQPHLIDLLDEVEG
jgi:hypothetical protein